MTHYEILLTCVSLTTVALYYFGLFSVPWALGKTATLSMNTTGVSTYPPSTIERCEDLLRRSAEIDKKIAVLLVEGHTCRKEMRMLLDKLNAPKGGLYR